MNKNIVTKVVISGVIVKDGRALIIKRADTEDSYPGLWEIPGGKKDFFETPLKCLKREVFEEAGLRFNKAHLLSIFCYRIIKPNEVRDCIQINYLIKLFKDHKIILSDSHSSTRWVGAENLNDFYISSKTKKVIEEGISKCKDED